MTRNNTRTKEFNQLLNRWADFYGEENVKLIRLLMSKGVSVLQIAKHLDINHSAINKRLKKWGKV